MLAAPLEARTSTMTNSTIAIVLACGEDNGLGPLIRERTKAAVPFAGEYRVIDFVLSNCLHSGLRRVLVFTQSRSYSLQVHLRDGWTIFNSALGEFVMPVAPQMRTDGGWYKGSADALVQNAGLINRSEAERVLVLSGEHVYRMDYAALQAAHEASGNDVTIACIECRPENIAGRLAVDCDPQGRVQSMQVAAGLPQSVGDVGDPQWVSMEIALFTRAALDEALSECEGVDAVFDLYRDILPRLLERCQVGIYRFGGTSGRVSQDRYWSDVTTIDDYFGAHMGLLEPLPSLDLYQSTWQIWSYPSKNPPARTAASSQGNEGIFVNSIVSNGTVIVGGAVSRSVLCPRVRVDDSATVERSVLLSGVSVGAGAQLRNCVVDKRVSIPPGVRVGFDQGEDAERFFVSEHGTVVVPEGHDAW